MYISIQTNTYAGSSTCLNLSEMSLSLSLLLPLATVWWTRLGRQGLRLVGKQTLYQGSLFPCDFQPSREQEFLQIRYFELLQFTLGPLAFDRAREAVPR